MVYCSHLQILSMPVGYEELARGFHPVKNGEICLEWIIILVMQFSLIPTMKYPTSDLISVIIHATSSRVSMQKKSRYKLGPKTSPPLCVSSRPPRSLWTHHPHPLLHDSQTVMTECLWACFFLHLTTRRGHTSSRFLKSWMTCKWYKITLEFTIKIKQDKIQ